jgi:hypothetical protein
MLLHAVRDQNIFTQGDFFDFSVLFMYFIQPGFICRPSDSTVSEDAGTQELLRHWQLAVRHFNHSRLDLVHKRHSCTVRIGL